MYQVHLDPVRTPLITPYGANQAHLLKFSKIQRRIRRLRLVLVVLQAVLFGYTLYALCTGFNQLELLDRILSFDQTSAPLFVDTTARVSVFLLLLLAIPVGLAAVLVESFTGCLMLAIAQLSLFSLLFLIQPPQRLLALKFSLALIAGLSIWYSTCIRKRRNFRYSYV
jgi:hypothetical protein